MADSPPQVTLTIEGAQVTVPRGTMILEAAKQAGQGQLHHLILAEDLQRRLRQVTEAF